MTAYKPYRHQLRRSLFASTIFPVFLVIIIGSPPNVVGI
ncbi:two-component sensor histidine kinase [Staphylococcus aureus]|nr:two-component sensor histidine kinase [Staphylococcus aureus]GBS82515.1 two-component sensor histidine kinase [Staphylococcus aureus]GBS85031.1 two-component sensor histidine kinase [Staphylococcus aureus]GBT79300.1 two-component sensor histidine kinase [Staphylococcus aureus]GBT81640.1 two-component sensor histidine kinase [Staphylococcus aureus]